MSLLEVTGYALLRPDPGAARHLRSPSTRGQSVADPRPERRGQDDHAAGAVRHGRARGQHRASTASDVARQGARAIARLGIAHVPEGRGTFTELTVEENLRVGALHAQATATCRRTSSAATSGSRAWASARDAARRQPQRRRAADARGRARADAAAAAAAARRAVARPRAARHPRAVRDPRRIARDEGITRARRRAEREPGAEARRLRLRARGGPDRAVGHGRPSWPGTRRQRAYLGV